MDVIKTAVLEIVLLEALFLSVDVNTKMHGIYLGKQNQVHKHNVY